MGTGPGGDPRTSTPDPTVLVMLTDGRFPSGGHAYSAGMEQAVTWGDVVDLDSAEAFAVGRVATSSTTAAQVAAAASVVACAGPVRPGEGADPLDDLDAEVDARMASAAARAVSRQQGRRWLRAVRGVWPGPLSGGHGHGGPAGPDRLGHRHAWVVTGAACGLMGLDPSATATVTLYDLVGTPLWAAVRLLGLDPVATAAVVARVVADWQPSVRRAAVAAALTAAEATADPGRPVDWSWISWSTAPMSDLAAEAHLRREERLFAS